MAKKATVGPRAIHCWPVVMAGLATAEDRRRNARKLVSRSASALDGRILSNEDIL